MRRASGVTIRNPGRENARINHISKAGREICEHRRDLRIATSVPPSACQTGIIGHSDRLKVDTDGDSELDSSELMNGVSRIGPELGPLSGMTQPGSDDDEEKATQTSINAFF